MDATESSVLMDKEIFGFQQELSSGLCWFKTKEQAKQAVKSFEIATGTKFITLSHDVYDRSKSRIWWRMSSCAENAGLFDGVPYILLETTKLECQHGKDRDMNRKEKRRRLSLEKGNIIGIPKRKYVQVKGSKKKNCEACVVIKDTIRFPQFTIEADIRCRRERASRKLREALRLQATLIEEYRCYVSFPLRSSHSGHEPGEAKGFLLSDVPDLSKKRLTIAVELEEPAVPHPTWSQTVHIITDALPSHAEPSNAVDTCSVAAINGGRETDGENSLEVVENLLKKDPAKESTSPKHLGMEEQDVSFVNSSRESTVSSNGVLPKVRSSEM